MSDKSLEIRIGIAAPPGRVYQALTSPDELTVWLAEEADVALDAGVYVLFGSSVPAGGHRLLGYEQDRELILAWNVGGVDVTETFTLEAADGGTKLHFVHDGPPGWEDAGAGVGHFWSNGLINLANHCEGLPVGPRHDFGGPVRGDARAELDVAASPAEAFAVLTDAAQVSRWCGGRATVEPEVGGRYDFGWGEAGGPVKILELEPGRVLAYSWNEKTAPDTVVRWELEGSEGGTHLTVVHSGFGDLRSDGYSAGWLGFLMEIRRLLALGPDYRRMDWS